MATTDRSLRSLRAYLPGFLVVVIAVTASYLLAQVQSVLSALLVSLVLGVLVRNTYGVRASWQPGITWATKKTLRMGVVLLGFQLSIPELQELGVGELVTVVVTVLVTFLLTLVIGKLLRVSSTMTLLVATGFSICGASAVAAMSAVNDADDDEVATAVALVTLYGTLAIVVMPALQSVAGFNDHQMGVWIGASVHEVAQVVAAATAVSAACLTVATLVKLGRVVLLAPMVTIVGALRRLRPATVGTPGGGAGTDIGPDEIERESGGGSENSAENKAATAKRPPIIPLFVVGFLICICIRSWVPLPIAFFDTAKVVTTMLLTAAMFCLGTGVHIRTVVATGTKAALLGLIATVIAVLVAFAGISMVG